MADSVTLDFRGDQQAKILAELADMRNDIRALRGDMDIVVRMVVRLDDTVDAMRKDMRGLWLDQRALRERLERLEERRP